MSTIDDLINRIHREWLSTPESQPAVVAVNGSHSSVETTIALTTTHLSVEEKTLIAPGTLLEDFTTGELMRVDSFSDPNVVVTRGVLGTSGTAISDGDELVIEPLFPKSTLLNVLGDVVEDISPPLFGISTTTETIPTSGYVDAPANCIGVQQAIGVQNGNYFKVGVQFVNNFSPATNDKAFFFVGPSGKTVYVTYKHTLTRPTDYADTFATLGLEESWQRLLMVGAVAQIVGATDIDALHAEYITAQLETEHTPVGTGLQLRSALMRYYQYLLDQARHRLRREAPIVPAYNGVVW